VRSEVRYLTLAEVIGQHERLMREYGQPSVLMDEGKLESAVLRPQHAAYYEDANLPRQGALLVAGIAQAHAFKDGNKRLALLAGATFLRLNGIGVVAERDAFAQAVIDFVLRHEGDPEGAVSVLASWLERRARPFG
jgi:death-on-curing protein